MTEEINPESEAFRDGVPMGKLTGGEKEKIQKIREACTHSDSFIIFAEYDVETDHMETFTNIPHDKLSIFFTLIMNKLID